MYFTGILAFLILSLQSSLSYSNEDCHVSLESLKKDLSEVSHEESIDINNDGTKENLIFWGCGSSGCNSSLVLKTENCFSVVLEGGNITLQKGIPKTLPEMYQRISSEYLIAESSYADCLGFNSTKQLFIYSKQLKKYERFYEENIRLCDYQDHLANN